MGMYPVARSDTNKESMGDCKSQHNASCWNMLLRMQRKELPEQRWATRTETAMHVTTFSSCMQNFFKKK